MSHGLQEAASSCWNRADLLRVLLHNAWHTCWEKSLATQWVIRHATNAASAQTLVLKFSLKAF
jgi:hypothetical protein